MFQKNKSNQGVNIIAEGTVLEGKMETTTPVMVFGNIVSKGVAICSTSQVIVAEPSTIEGDVSGNHIEISGCITGNIVAKGQLKIKRTATIFGNVKANSIVIEDGANFTGSVEVFHGIFDESKMMKVEKTDLNSDTFKSVEV